jgi:hypothetical protein
MIIKIRKHIKSQRTDWSGNTEKYTPARLLKFLNIGTEVEVEECKGNQSPEDG